MSRPFQVTVTLTSDLVSRIFIESGAYHLYFQSRNPKFGVWIHLCMIICLVSFGSL